MGRLRNPGINTSFKSKPQNFKESDSVSCLGVLFQVAAGIFVEGFALAKKCTNEGRALMQLDYRQFVLKAEAISGLRPLPYQAYVSAYVKAFYIPDSELELWVQSHPEYSAAQLVALVNSVAYSNNKTRQKLNALISDLSVRIRRDKF